MDNIRFLPIIVPFLTGILLEIFYLYPKLIYSFSFLLVFFYAYAIQKFLRYSKVKERVSNFLILPAFFTVGLIVFSTMISSKFLIQFLFAINITFLYFYFSSIYNFLINTDKYKNGSLENFSAHGNFLSVYFIASSIYGLQSLVGFSIIKLVFPLVFLIALIAYQVMWSNKINLRQSSMYILLICLVMIEVAWTLSFLTLSYYILGLILAIFYYILIGLIRFYLLGNFQRQIVKLYLIFGLSSITIVLLTSRWIN